MTKLHPDVNRQLVSIKNHLVDVFNESNWLELGMLTNQAEEVQKHPRLLRSYRFGDDDYEMHCISMLQKMVKYDPRNLIVIDRYINEKCPEAGEDISSNHSNGRKIVFSPTVFKIPDESVDDDLISVMMPFEGSFSATYRSIQSAAKNEGFDCLRADDIWDDSTVIQDVFTLIFRSYIVICDFTGKNPNVFYEAGIAHTLGKHVIPITQNAGDVPFDLRHHRYIKYLNNKEGQVELTNKLMPRIEKLAGMRE